MALIPPFVFSGSLAICAGVMPDSVREWCALDNAIVVEAEIDLGFIGYAMLKGEIGLSPFVIRATAEVNIEKLTSLVPQLIDVIVKVIAGTSDPEKNPVSKVLKLIFSLMQFIVGGRLDIDTSANKFEVCLKLNIMGSNPWMCVPIPMPGRRHLQALENGLLTRTVGEATDPLWAHLHPDDQRLNATKRRALGNACDGVPTADMSMGDLVRQVGDAFGEFLEMVRAIAPIDAEFEFEIGIDEIGLTVSGLMHFQLATSGHMMLRLAASFSLFGILVSGDIELSTSGGISYMHLLGVGKIPQLCSVCPVLEGHLKMVKERRGDVTVGMETSLELGCFIMEGAIELSTAGGLRNFLLSATNPMCLLETLKDVINMVIPGAGQILVAITLRVNSVQLMYSGGSLSLEISVGLSDDAADSDTLTLSTNTAIKTVEDVKDLLLSSASSLLDLFDDFMNTFYLNFFDLAVGHDPINWGFEFGQRNMAGTGQGAAAMGRMKLTNSAYARLGLFGAAFGVDLDNSVETSFFSLGKTAELVSASLALKLDAQLKNPIASDLANAFSDAVRSIIPFEADAVKPLNNAALDVISPFRDVTCTIRDACRAIINGLDWVGQPNAISTGLGAVMEASSQLLYGIETALLRGATVRDQLPEMRTLREMMNKVVYQTADYFSDPQALSAVVQIHAVDEQLQAMVVEAKSSAQQVKLLISALTTMLDIITQDEASSLKAVATWGTVVRDLFCMLKKAPDWSNRLEYHQRALPTLFGLLRTHGIALVHILDLNSFATMLPAYPGSSTSVSEALDRELREDLLSNFMSFEFLCAPVQAILAQVVQDVGSLRLQRMADFRNAVDQRQLVRAANLLSAQCNSLAISCDAAVATLQAGCATAPSWMIQPVWSSTGYAQFASGDQLEVALLGMGIPALTVIGGRTYHSVSMDLRLALVVHARAACSATLTVQLKARLVQPAARITFFSEDNVSSLTEKHALTMAAALHVRRDGLLVTQPGAPERWWAQHSSLFADATPISDLGERPAEVCERAGAHGGAGRADTPVQLSVHLEVVMNGSQSLFVSSKSPISKTLEMARLQQRPQLFSIAPSPICHALCAQGLIAIPLRAELANTMNASTSPWTPLASVPTSGNVCFDYLWQDYATCTINKAHADRRFAQCLTTQVGAADPSLQYSAATRTFPC